MIERITGCPKCLCFSKDCICEKEKDMTDKQPRFFIDHGVIHDRVTGKHVTTNETQYIKDENGNPMLDNPIGGQDDIHDCLALLNQLAGTPQPKLPDMRLHQPTNKDYMTKL